MTAAEVLRAARSKIESPDACTSGVFARDALGNPVSALSPAAVCWCMVGAIYAVTVEIGADLESMRNAEILLANAVSDSDVWSAQMAILPIAKFGDDATHEQRLAMFDKAIALAESA